MSKTLLVWIGALGFSLGIWALFCLILWHLVLGWLS